MRRFASACSRVAAVACLGAALLPGLQACGITDSDDGPADLDRALEVWQASGLRDYAYTVERSCFCPAESIGPVRVRVRDGVVIEASYVVSGLAVGQFGDLFPAVPGLFALIEDAIRQGAHAVDVSYDDVFGFPTEISIDYIENAIDDELVVWAGEFQAGS